MAPCKTERQLNDEPTLVRALAHRTVLACDREGAKWTEPVSCDTNEHVLAARVPFERCIILSNVFDPLSCVKWLSGLRARSRVS
jgi:hypothetical protein